VNHSDVKNCMADYLEGDLSLDERALFDAHLDDCPACSREIAEMRGTISLLRSLPEPATPAGLADQVMRRIRSGEGEPRLADRLRQLVDGLLAPRILAPVSAAALAAGLVLWSGQVQIGSTTGRSAEATPLQITVAGPQADRSESLAARRSGDVGDALTGGALGASAAEGQSAASERVEFMTRDQWRSLGLGFDVDPLVGLIDLGSPSGGRQLVMPSGDRAPEAVPVADNRLRSAVVAGRVLPSSDDWLSLIETEPAVFADHLSGLSLAEQELWVDRLARRAHETGRFDQVVGALRASSNGLARQLGADFAAVATATGRATAGSDGTSGTPD